MSYKNVPCGSGIGYACGGFTSPSHTGFIPTNTKQYVQQKKYDPATLVNQLGGHMSSDGIKLIGLGHSPLEDMISAPEPMRIYADNQTGNFGPGQHDRGHSQFRGPHSLPGSSYGKSFFYGLKTDAPNEYAGVRMYGERTRCDYAKIDEYRRAAERIQDYRRAEELASAPTITTAKDIGIFVDSDSRDDITDYDETQLISAIKESFEKTTKKRFPTNIKLKFFAGGSSEIKKFNVSPDVLGFAINKKGRARAGMILPKETIIHSDTENEGLESEVFIRLGSLDRMLVVAGHELGHVLTPQLSDSVHEEGKAFAFMLEWIHTIKLHNIANLGAELRIPDVAKNNIHDKSLEFVMNMNKKGWQPMNIFRGICEGLMKISA